MAKDSNVTKPTPGDPDYYDYITGTGKYGKKPKVPQKTKVAIKKTVKPSGLGLSASEKMLVDYENGKKKKKLFGGSAGQTLKRAFSQM
jgi:tRNA-binding EMAP/Myf-like protein